MAVANAFKAVASLSGGGFASDLELHGPASRRQGASAEATGRGRPENREITHYISRITDIWPEGPDDPLAEDDSGAGEARRPQ